MLYEIKEGDRLEFGGLQFILRHASNGRACVETDLLPQLNGKKTPAPGTGSPLRERLANRKHLTPAAHSG